MAFQQNPLNSQHIAMNTDMNPWMQVTPSVMPWTLESRPELVRFGETSGECNSWSSQSKLKYYKRKSDLDFNPKPTKMHITEDKVAAQLKNMHISQNYSCEQGFGDGMDNTSDGLLPTLILSKEVQNLPNFPQSLIPESLLPKVEKPTGALVLWKPPAGSLTAQIISTLRSEPVEEDDNVNNNTSTPDLNAMTTRGLTSSTMEMEM